MTKAVLWNFLHYIKAWMAYKHTQELIYRKNKRSAHVIVFLARKRRLNKKFGVVTLILDEWCSLGDLRGRKKKTANVTFTLMFGFSDQ